jgi:hypothetical protein
MPPGKCVTRKREFTFHAPIIHALSKNNDGVTCCGYAVFICACHEREFRNPRSPYSTGRFFVEGIMTATVTENRIGDSLAALVAIANAAHRIGDTYLERSAKRELQERFGIKVTFARKRDKECAR